MKSDYMYDLIVVGGGAAGYMTAIQTAIKRPDLRIAICEQSKKVLNKVRISGGGRCNVTHACWDPKELSQYYPRGKKELIGPFNKFMTGDTMDFFESNGVKLKIEDDGRVFPVSNNSEDIASCLESIADSYQVELFLLHKLMKIDRDAELWKLEFANNNILKCKKLMLAAGSSKIVWNILKEMGIKIIDPVPSLFTFNIRDSRLKDLAGVSVEHATVSIPDLGINESGAVLITHWGLSGPGILKLSAIGAIELYDRNYEFNIAIDFFSGRYENFENFEHEWKSKYHNKSLSEIKLNEIPRRLFTRLISGLPQDKNHSNFTKKEIHDLYKALCLATFNVIGKSTYKNEFVTAGGVDLSEMDMRRFSLKQYPSVHIAGELLNIDALTGGFNFQAAWTGGYIAAESITEELK